MKLDFAKALLQGYVCKDCASSTLAYDYEGGTLVMCEQHRKVEPNKLCGDFKHFKQKKGSS